MRELLLTDNLNIIKKAKMMYANRTYHAIIVQSDIFYGTGDYEDFEDICGDKEIDCYYVWLENLIYKEIYNVGCGCFMSLEDAISNIESKTEFVEWRF